MNTSLYVHVCYSILGHIGAATARDGAALGMDVVGYDPGLSVESALKLPDEIKLKVASLFSWI